MQELKRGTYYESCDNCVDLFTCLQSMSESHGHLMANTSKIKNNTINFCTTSFYRHI